MFWQQKLKPPVHDWKPEWNRCAWIDPYHSLADYFSFDHSQALKNLRDKFFNITKMKTVS